MVSTLFIWGLFAASLIQKKYGEQKQVSITWATLWDKLKEKFVWEKKKEEEKPKTKIEQLRKKYALRGLILEANSYYSNEQFALALKRYLEVYDQVGDKVTAERVADTYFKMQKFWLAHKYYVLVWDAQSKEKAFISLMYSTPLSQTGSIDPLIEEMKLVWLSEEKMFFYKTALECVKDFHTCKKNFSDYISANAEKLTTDEMKTIQMTLENYANFKLDDVQYKDALVTWAFYELSLYPIVVELWNATLAKTPTYKPVLLMVWQSYYELWNFEKAKSILWKYKEIEPNDKNVTYLLWVINLKLHEYILSNILLNKALELWYTPSINVHRRLAFNYEILSQDERMLGELKTIVEKEKDFEKEDAYLAIYYHIIDNKIPTALELVKFALQKFPDDANIYGYMGWIYRDMKDFEKAKQSLEKGFTLDKNNPLLHLNMWYIFLEMWDTENAKIYFQKTVELDTNGDFWKQAQEQLVVL